MSGELKDFRGKITAETDAALEGLAQATGRDRSEIAREIMHEWAVRQIHAATVLTSRLRAEGLDAIAEGIVGSGGGKRGHHR